MLTIKRRYITAQVLLEAVDEEGNFVEEFPSPPIRLLRKDEKQLSSVADRLAAKLVAELNEKGRAARMGTTATMEAVYGETGLPGGASYRKAQPSRARKGKSGAECSAGDLGGESWCVSDEGEGSGA
jgi:hypothetical protein